LAFAVALSVACRGGKQARHGDVDRGRPRWGVRRLASWVYPAALQRVAMQLRIVAPVALNQPRLAHGPTRTATERRNRVDQWQELGDVVAIGDSQQGHQPDAVRLSENVVLRPRLTAIG
jgi:hypothetical protein